MLIRQYRELLSTLHAVQRGLNLIVDQLNRMEKNMADRSKELQAAFDDLAATFGKLATDIDSQLKVIANPGTPDAAVDKAIAAAQSLVASMKQKAADLEADDPPVTPVA